MSEELEVTVLFVGNCHLTKARDRAQTDSFCRDVAILAKVQQSLKVQSKSEVIAVLTLEFGSVDTCLSRISMSHLVPSVDDSKPLAA